MAGRGEQACKRQSRWVSGHSIQEQRGNSQQQWDAADRSNREEYLKDIEMWKSLLTLDYKLLFQDSWAWNTCLRSLRRTSERRKYRTFTRTLTVKAKRNRAAVGAG